MTIEQIYPLTGVPFTERYLEHNTPLKAFRIFQNHAYLTAIVLAVGDSGAKNIALRKWRKKDGEWKAQSNFIMNNKKQVLGTISALEELYELM